MMARDDEKDKKALALFAAAASVDQIMTTCGFRTKTAAVAAVRRALAARIEVESADEERARQLEQLDALHRSLWPKALRGDVNAVDRVMRIQESRERLARMPDDLAGSLVEAFESTVGAAPLAEIDAAVVATGRRLAYQIDTVVRAGKPIETTKALYLVPHLMNVLREIGATPSARDAVSASVPTASGSEDGVSDFASFKRAKGGAA